MKKSLLIFLLSLFILRLQAQSTVTIGSTSVFIDTIYTGLDVPWEVIYGPDNHLWVTERKGKVSRIDPATKTQTVILNLSGTLFAQSETGLLGMALHPDFTINKEVFLVYTFGTNNNIYERLVKYTYNNAILANPQTLIDSIPGAINHDGSRLLFMPDKTLLMSTGDALTPASAQNMNSKSGKILRLNTNGTIPANNPFPNSYVYTLGHRNPQGMLLAPNGRIYISEHGPNNDDEFQVLESGRNYGWPNVEGFCNLPGEITFCNANNVKEPIFNWTPTIAPNDLAWYSNPGLPEFDGRVIMAVLKDKKLVALKLDAAGTGSVSQNSYLVNQFGRIRDVCVGPVNEIYFATNGNGTGNDANTHSIFVLKPVNFVSVPQNKLPNPVKIYPTITTDLIHIEMEQTAQDLSDITVIDLLGKISLQASMEAKQTSINISNLQPGVYFLILTGQNKSSSLTKIIKY